MDAIKDVADGPVNSFLLEPAYHDILSIVKAARNGIVYGCKVRFPHALVMVFLFKGGTLKEKILAILGATRMHATNLATFAVTYKSLMLLFKALPTVHRKPTPPSPSLPNLPKRTETPFDTFIAGCAAGYLVFGRRKAAKSSVNQQIVIYVFARVCLGLAKLAIAPKTPATSVYQAGYGHVKPGGADLLETIFGGSENAEKYKKLVARNSWAVFASVSWGMVMWLFHWHPDVVQPSLKSSMRYLYENAEVWDGWRNFIWHNL